VEGGTIWRDGEGALTTLCRGHWNALQLALAPQLQSAAFTRGLGFADRLQRQDSMYVKGCTSTFIHPRSLSSSPRHICGALCSATRIMLPLRGSHFRSIMQPLLARQQLLGDVHGHVSMCVCEGIRSVHRTLLPAFTYMPTSPAFSTAMEALRDGCTASFSQPSHQQRGCPPNLTA
jgi:hypothetical protein